MAIVRRQRQQYFIDFNRFVGQMKKSRGDELFGSNFSSPQHFTSFCFTVKECAIMSSNLPNYQTSNDPTSWTRKR
jgi:hypothetical protein